MPALTVEEASGAYAGAMRNVLRAGPGVCAICKTFIGVGWRVCYPCNNQPNHLDAVAPITYSESLGQMHLALRAYKEGLRQVRTYAAPRLNGILWRFTTQHEACVAAASGVSEFQVVTTVPSGDPARDERTPHLRTLVEACGPLQERFERLLRPNGQVHGREYDEQRYAAQRELSRDNVLLIDDTWVTGGHAQSAAYALERAGAGAIGFIAIGRQVRPEWEVDGTPSGELLDALPRVFDWNTCAVHQM